MVDPQLSPVPLYRKLLGTLTGVPLAVLYGIVTRWIFGVEDNDLLIVMTLAFILIVPLALGALTLWVAPRPLLGSLSYAIFMPWLTSLITVGVIALMRLEEVVCIVMALPLFLPLSSLGGVAVRWLRNRGAETGVSSLMGVLLLGPYLLAPLEMQAPVAENIRTVENSIVIAADAETVWANIVTVSPIGVHEQRHSLFHLIGLPRPLKAEMANPGTTGVRYGHFEEGLIFVEVVTAWQPNEYLAFTIDRDEHAPMPALLQQIDGVYFGLLDGFYRIEPLADGTVRLYLSSRHRLTTHFNRYAGLWTDAVMADLQQDILEIVRDRSEGSR